MRVPKQPPTALQVIAKYRYDEVTGIFTHRLSGKQAGTIGAGGFTRILLNGTQLAANKLAWLMIWGEYPTGSIIHLNDNKSDNAIANLILAKSNNEDLARETKLAVIQNTANSKNKTPADIKRKVLKYQRVGYKIFGNHLILDKGYGDAVIILNYAQNL